jgi:NAD(P)-dependent dehydrogenase (short-subunit alcohol dehydrogenase family)
MKLVGRQALITGGSRGFGRQLARTFWENGASVLLIARTAADLAAVRDSLSSPIPGQAAHTLALDLTAPDAVEKILAEVKLRFGGLDILVNNAGDQGTIGPLWENDWAMWEYSLRLNLLVPAALCRAAIPILAQRSGASIINLSGGGATGPRPNFSTYATAKAAIVRFSETLAHEARAMNIKVNCIAPGAMYSRMQGVVLEAGPQRAGEKDFKVAQELRDKAASGDNSVARRAAELCVFLASSESDGITGKLISALWDPWPELARHQADLEKTDVYTLRRIVCADRGLDWGQS